MATVANSELITPLPVHTRNEGTAHDARELADGSITCIEVRQGRAHSLAALVLIGDGHRDSYTELACWVLCALGHMITCQGARWHRMMNGDQLEQLWV